ncbi:carboxymuconolactone decarboxylase family protein [Nocardiopsis sp. FIRDI 009]|uniref:carboxymuconolactone decarboxylase family protein n=1 Tax=Nocardiopsis sp. FIRDI 009 TaxID=714197 RepID=UPI000E23E9CE|nr:carboxymuconolactone decarboxylase family protein [Nocardiopsis sp. FIRDI 009]
MSDVAYEPRMEPRQVAPQLNTALAALHDKAVGFLDPLLTELVLVRAAQLSGNAHGVDRHTQTAAGKGESDRRLHAVAVWRQTDLFTPKERAALDLAEAMTVAGGGPVPDRVWEEARARFSEGELAHLVFSIATANAVNQVDVAVGRRPE